MYSEDREYVERILAGELDVFESLVRKYNRLGGSIAYGILGDFHQAEDAVQDAFLHAFRSLPNLRDGSKFRSWFAGLVRSRALDAFRRRRSHGTVALPDDLPAAGFTDPSPLEQAEAQEEVRRKVLEAIAELPPEDRTVIVLKHMEGLSYKEIAELTETSVSAVESRLFRARLALKKKLDPSTT